MIANIWRYFNHVRRHRNRFQKYALILDSEIKTRKRGKKTLKIDLQYSSVSIYLFKLSFRFSFITVFIYLFIYLSIYLFIYLFNLFIYLFIYSLIYLFISLFTYLLRITWLDLFT